MPNAAPILLLGAEDEENLALRSLAAYLEEHAVPARIVGFSSPRDTNTVLAAVRRYAPPLLGMSVAFQCKAPDSFDLLAKVRQQGYRGHIVVGGHFPTFEYRQILESQPAIDSVIRFEGEEPLLALTQVVTGAGTLARVPNLVYRAAGTLVENPCVHSFMDLDALPFPVRGPKVQQRLGERFGSLVASRGCWHSSCIYCCIGAFHRQKQQKFALRSAGNVADEIALLHRRHGIALLQFHDDNFVLATPELTCRRLNDLRCELKARRVPTDRLAFLIKARPDVVDESVAEALAELGFVGVFLGVENATESGLRAMARGADLGAIHRAMAALKARRIAVTYNLLVFHPHATIKEIQANIEFVRQRPSWPFDFGRAEIVAGSPLEKLVENEGLRCGRWPNWDYRLGDPVVQRLCDIYRETFRGPGAVYSSLMHELIALCYHAATLRRLHPGPAAETLSDAVSELIAQANTFVIECLEEAVDLAQRPVQPANPGALRQRLDRRCAAYVAQADTLSREMLRLQTVEKVFGSFGIRSMAQESAWIPSLFGFRKAPVAPPARPEFSKEVPA